MVTLLRVPDAGSLQTIFEFSSYISRVEAAAEYEIDFSDVRFVTPCWMIAVGKALRQLKALHPRSKRRAISFHHLSYAAHAGFFDFFGVKFGKPTSAAGRTENFIPVTVRSVEEIKHSALDRLLHHGDVIQDEAENLTSVLLQQANGAVFDTIAYSIREIVRNVVEHSQSEEYVFAAQFWPALEEAEIVVSDQGIGLAASLNSNPKYEGLNDSEAIRLAVRPGISSKSGQRQRREGHWRNSGYGLFMTSQLCSEGGGFSLLSHSKGVTSSNGKIEEMDVALPGTTVVMRLNTKQTANLDKRLEELRKRASQVLVQGTPSPASLSLRKR